MDAIETIEKDGYTIEIYHDCLSCDPREWDNLGTMVCFHNWYKLGDEHTYNPDDFQSWGELLDQIEADHGEGIALPLYLYDHSGITMATEVSPYWYHAAWDSMRVGWIFISKEKIKTYLKHEVETYAQFISGQTYGYAVKDRDGEEIDSCWGYYGYDFEENGLMEAAMAMVKYERTHQPEEIFCV